MATYKTKLTCVVCGKKRGRQRAYRLACSSPCKRVLDGKEKPELYEPVKCKHCETEFTPRASNNVFCSKNCLRWWGNKNRWNKDREFSIFMRDEFKCIYCGKSSIEHGIILQVDHITALSISGITDIDNLITACKPCNVAKHAKEFTDSIKIRLLSLVLDRNKKLTPAQLDCINDEIKAIKSRDGYRKNSLVKRERLQ